MGTKLMDINQLSPADKLCGTEQNSLKDVFAYSCNFKGMGPGVTETETESNAFVSIVYAFTNTPWAYDKLPSLSFSDDMHCPEDFYEI